MSEEAPKQLAIDGFIANSRVTYTQSIMLVEHKINVPGYVGLILAAVIVFVISLQFRDISLVFVGLLIAGILISGSFRERSYRYEFNKEKAEIKCKWGGYLGVFVDKDNEVKYPLSYATYVRIHQIPARGHDSFKLTIGLQNGMELDLPSDHSLGSSLEHANIYKDFFELKTPIKTTTSLF